MTRASLDVRSGYMIDWVEGPLQRSHWSAITLILAGFLSDYNMWVWTCIW